jgi:hypothetical protein
MRRQRREQLGYTGNHTGRRARDASVPLNRVPSAGFPGPGLHDGALRITSYILFVRPHKTLQAGKLVDSIHIAGQFRLPKLCREN